MAEFPAATPVIEKGTCVVLFAYDVGGQIDLDAAERRIQGLAQRDSIRRAHRAPGHFEYHPAPLRVTGAAERIPLGRWSTRDSVELVLSRSSGSSAPGGSR
jgi:hypothetical protein